MADRHEAGDTSGWQTAGLVELLNPPGGRAAGLCQATRLARAEAAYRGALERDSGNVAALHGLGLLCLQARRNDEALALLRRASDAAVGPHAAPARADLAAALGRLGRHAEAAAAGAEAVRLGPDDAGAWNNLGAALEHTGRAAEAADAYRRAIALRPEWAQPHNQLGNALRALGRLSEAQAAHREAIRLKPDFSQAYENLAATLTALGDAEQAAWYYRQLAALRPTDASTGSRLLLALHCSCGVSQAEMFSAHRDWAERHAGPLYPSGKLPAAPLAEDADVRKLRIGYVSPDFHEYPAARFFEPLLTHHDRSQFEIICYSDVRRPDAMTARLRSFGHGWREIRGLSDARAEQIVRQDRIDILVDLAGHIANPRLLLFARKPAPIQAAYIGYPNTTGLATMDYRLTDRWHDPAGPGPEATDAFHTERLVRLPRCCWSYVPGEALPPIGPLPAASAGMVTFGVMNRPVKWTPPMIEAWARIVSAVPGSRLLVLVGRRCEHEPAMREQFVRAGIDARRLLVVPQRPRHAYLSLFNEIDVGLDTFPYAGMTTTCDALWMGVPTVTLAGRTHVSRTGVSLMTAVGLPELIAQTPAEYVSRAVALACDLPALAALRAGLRERVQQSELADGAGLTRTIEACYRDMWHKWCGRSSHSDESHA